MMKSFFRSASLRNPRIWIVPFIAVQLAVAVVKIAVTYEKDFPLFSSVSWCSLIEPPAGRIILFNLLLVVLSFWASPFVKKKNYSLLSAGCYGYLLFISLLALINYAVMYVTRHFYPPVNWMILSALAGAGFGNIAALKERFGNYNQRAGTETAAGLTVSGWIAVALGLSLLPFLILPYHFCDTTIFWAPKAFAIAASANANALVLEPHSSYPPLYPIILSLSMGDRLFQGRLIPFLMFFAFLAVFARAVPAGKNISTASALVLLMATMQVWLGVVTFYADVPLMILLGAAGLLLTGNRMVTSHERNGIETGAAAILLCAAVLIRPDGLFSVAILLLCIFLSGKRKRSSLFGVLALIAIAVSLTWELRPGFLRGDPDFFKKVDPAQLLAWGGGFHFHTIVNFSYAAQGLLFSHYGFGAFFYCFIIAVIFGIRQKRAFKQEYRAYAVLSLISIIALVLMYIFIGLFLNFAMDYLSMVRVSFGRMAVHFFPFLLLYLLSLINAGTSEAGPHKAKQVTAVTN